MVAWNDWTNASVHQETHEFKSRVALCQTMLMQMEGMNEDGMQNVRG